VGKVVEAISNPESLKRSLDDYIAQLKAREEQLETTIKPIEIRLDESGIAKRNS